MAALQNKLSTLVLACLFSVACSSNNAQEVSDQELLDLLTRQVSQSVVSLEKKIETCEKIGSARTPNLILEDKPSELEATREQLLIAVGYLHFHNRFECEKPERQALAYSLGALESMADQLGMNPQAARDVSEGLVYKDSEELKYEVRFQRLPEGLQNHVKAAIGDKPFDLMGTLEENNLTKGTATQ